MRPAKLDLHAPGSDIVMVAFGFHVVLIAYLIFKSTFLPRIPGVWLAIVGLCYLTNSFANFLSPLFAARLLPYILVPGAVEMLLALWLLVMGVNVQRWREQASAAVEPREESTCLINALIYPVSPFQTRLDSSILFIYPRTGRP
jgi:hypothetical protein